MSHSMHVTLSYVYADRNAHVTALLVHSKNSFWGTETKNTAKDKCGISLAKDTSADAVFCLVPVRYSKTPSTFYTWSCWMLVRGEAMPWPCCQREQSRAKGFYSPGGREEPELGALSCCARETNYWTLFHKEVDAHPGTDISVCPCARLTHMVPPLSTFPTVSLARQRGLGREELLLSHSSKDSCNHLTLNRVREEHCTEYLSWQLKFVC